MPHETLSQADGFTITALEDQEPWETYDKLRAGTPVVWDRVMNAWVLMDYASCLEVETQEDRFRNPYQDVPQVVVDIKGGGRNITLLAGEEHRRMRRFLMMLMTPAKVESYTQQQILPVIDLLMGRVLKRGSGRADLTAEFGDQIPPRVIAALLGMPWQDDDLINEILRLHEEIMEVIGAAFRTEEIRQRGLRISSEINGLLMPYIRQRRDSPQDDFISHCWTESPEFEGNLTEADVVAIAREIFLGGADTTVHGIANLTYLTLTDGGVRQSLENARDAMLPAAIEESMRLYGSVMYRFRVANEDAVLGGQKIAKDDRVILMHSSANRDPAKYGCPHMADLSRRPSNDHLAFNKGPRSCVGIHLARAEMRESLKAVLTHMPNVRLDPDAEQPTFRGLFMRSWRPLNVIFDS